MKTTAIDGTEQVYDSRDIIERIEYLEQSGIDSDESARLEELNKRGDLTDDEASEREDLEARALDSDDAAELEALRALANECEGYADWQYGEQLISVDYFVEHIEELINDCYEMPKDMNSGEWPWRHMKIDYEAAAKEAEQDYALVTFMGRDFFIRNC